MSKTAHFQIRVSEDEKAQYKADAEAFGDSVSNWVRRCVRFARTELLPKVAGAPSNGHGVSAGVKTGVRRGKVIRNGKKKGR